jgi:NAD(P)-dependent dehydrogenase (short-subunit alcohol dehydrogenase family)
VARPTYSIRDRTVLITGPARGIGAETARRLVERGARVALAGVEPKRLEALAGELGEAAAWWETDVRDTAAVQRAVEAAAERFGGIDVVIANAGIAPPLTTIASVDPEAFERVIDVNLLGVWRTVRAALPHVRARRGYILCIASLAAAVHGPLMAPYNMSKAGVEALANSLRIEVEGYGVAVGCAYFGFIDTDMVRDSFAESPIQRLRTRAPLPLMRPLPVGAAARGIERGIERRAQRVIVPRAVTPIVFGGRLFQSIADAGARRAGIADVVRDVEAGRD